jgi:hypothetical protein
MLDAVAKSKSDRRWHQFSLNWMFMLVAIVAVTCGWFKWEIDCRQRARDVEAAIVESGGILLTNVHWRTYPKWKIQLFGERHYYPLAAVMFKGASASDADMRNVAATGTLRSVYLDGSDVTDAGLAELKVLTNLKLLLLTGTKVTDEGVADFHRALPDCLIER